MTARNLLDYRSIDEITDEQTDEIEVVYVGLQGELAEIEEAGFRQKRSSRCDMRAES